MSITIEALEKSFGNQPVLRSISETFAEGAISVLLGPSGCGKTTTLRCIAGLERPSAGRIAIGRRTVYQATPAIWVPPERRQIAMVFQSYAIWPHMSVFENVAVPLQAAGMTRAKIRDTVTDTLRLVGLQDFARHSATHLSGGQQQRVALARCIVSESPVILMDEPLSNLDARLRVSMRTEIRELQRRLGRTLVFVTHDQEEAMSIADTIYLFCDGRVIQKGAPRDVYENPVTRYAAEFIGRANIITDFARTATASGHAYALSGGVSLPAISPGTSSSNAPAEGAVLCIRPEKWRLVSPDAPGAIAARILAHSFAGDRTEYRIAAPFGEVLAIELNARARTPGDTVGLAIAADDIRLI